ncbi:MAG: MFS transporter [Polyangia bacterium]
MGDATYRRRLLLWLGSATFFEGFDFMALGQVLPELRQGLHLSKQSGATLVGLVNAGMLLSFFIVRLADRYGRRPVMLLSIACYALATLATALTQQVEGFVGWQLCARAFLVAELSLAPIFVAEEYPAERRGAAIALVLSTHVLGMVACAGLVPVLLRTPWGWRTVFLSGAVPLVLALLGLLLLRETRRFQALPAEPRRHRSLLHILRTPYRGRVLLVAAAWGATYLCTQSAALFWREFALSERGLSTEQVGRALSLSVLLALPVVAATGRLIDRLGRRRGAVVPFTMAFAGVAAAYSLHSAAALTVALTIGLAGCSAVLPILNAYTAELFPTDLRSDATAWANGLLGRSAAVLAPIGTGLIAERSSWGLGVLCVTPGPLLALLLILFLFPETRGRELEQTAELARAAPP